ncbi:hypothetical protein DXG01_012697 [Tephrocybe rancida]|nr:hypothetical protein DXG01_012697 [Tephrocybe rancida]
MTSNEFPQFPENIPTHPLLIIDFDLLKRGDEAEIDRLWEASTKLGFWYLKNHGVDDEVTGMFDMGAKTMSLPIEEKMKFEQGNEGMSFGYKSAGANAVDASGKKDAVEFINVAKDDALAWPGQVHRSYPPSVNDRMESTVTPFIRKSVEVNNLLLGVLNAKLGLPAGTLLEKHRIEEPSGSESRVTRTPPVRSTSIDPAIGSHTDFGSLSFLHNRLGGLQVLVPGIDTWQYVKRLTIAPQPIKGHAICNVGDALSIFSGGILPPPGYQSFMERWSLVYFTRPGNSIILRPLVDESRLIADAVARSPTMNLNTGATSSEWFTRRIKNQRLENRKTLTPSLKGPETWMASRGTEEVEDTGVKDEADRPSQRR